MTILAKDLDADPSMAKPNCTTEKLPFDPLQTECCSVRVGLGEIPSLSSLRRIEQEIAAVESMDVR